MSEAAGARCQPESARYWRPRFLRDFGCAVAWRERQAEVEFLDVLANCASLLTIERPGLRLSIRSPGLDQTTSCRTSMTQSPNITRHPKIERLPAGGLPGWCCEERNCPECLRIYREGLALRRQERAARRKLRQSSPDGLKTAAQAAIKLNCSIKTLRAHVAAGDLRYVSIGKGTKRPRRMFTDPDIND